MLGRKSIQDRKMKLTIVVCTILALVSADWTPKTPEEVNKIREACFVETKLSDHCIEMVKKGEFPDEPGCYYRCVGLKSGMWDDTNGYDTEKGYQTVYAAGYDVQKEDVVKCNTADKHEDACVWAAKTAKCMWDNKFMKRRTQ